MDSQGLGHLRLIAIEFLGRGFEVYLFELFQDVLEVKLLVHHFPDGQLQFLPTLSGENVGLILHRQRILR